MDKLTSLQWNNNEDQDDIKHDIGDVKVMDYDLHDKTSGESIYCIKYF